MTDAEVLVAGATGFVGRRLVAALDEAGVTVRAMTRRPESYDGPGTAVWADVHEPGTLHAALAGCSAAYYLIHSLTSPDFEVLDAQAARAFGAAAAEAGVRQIVYLGGLGRADDTLSAHLRSRREVEELLGAGGVPVTVLRAGIVVGHGGLSWEITRQLVQHLPAMVTPRWVRTRTQPIAVDDVVRYLVGVLGNESCLGRVFEVGGPEVLEYASMMQRVAAIQRRPLPIVPVPLLSPNLSSRWLTLVTDVDRQAGRALVDSMVNEVVVRDDAIRRVVPFELTSYDDAVRRALAERRAEKGAMSGMRARLVGRLPRPLTHSVPVRHDEQPSTQRRRRVVVVLTALAGAGMLGVSLSSRPGSRRFYASTLAVAAVWTVGGFASGPLHLGWIQTRDDRFFRPLLTPAATGVGVFGFFYGCALVARRIPLMHGAIARVLAFAEDGSKSLVLVTALANGVGEELFFRGALFTAVGDRHPVVVSTGVYTAATLATRNPALVLAAGAMGTLFGLQRRATGGLQAPLVTHLTWSTLMIRFLPPLFRRAARNATARR